MSDAFRGIGNVLGNIGSTIGTGVKDVFGGLGGGGSIGQGQPGYGWQQLGNILGKALPVGLAGAGVAGNYLNQRKIQQAVDQQLAYQKYLQGLVTNPAAFQKFAAGYTQPLTAGLVEGVENQAQGWLAEHGLSQSPAIAGDVMNQALAPYIQQQQNQGIQNALNALGMGSNPYATQLLARQGGGTDLTSLLKLIQARGGQSGQGSLGNVANINPLDMGEVTGQNPIASSIDWSQIPDLTIDDLAGGFGNVSGVQQ